jgi:hypothetical protein
MVRESTTLHCPALPGWKEAGREENPQRVLSGQQSVWLQRGIARLWGNPCLTQSFISPSQVIFMNLPWASESFMILPYLDAMSVLVRSSAYLFFTFPEIDPVTTQCTRKSNKGGHGIVFSLNPIYAYIWDCFLRKQIPRKVGGERRTKHSRAEAAFRSPHSIPMICRFKTEKKKWMPKEEAWLAKVVSAAS